MCAHDEFAAAVAYGDQDAAVLLMRDHMIEYVRYVEERYPALLDESVTWQ